MSERGSLHSFRDRAVAGLPLFGKRRHDAAYAIQSLLDEALRLRAALDGIAGVRREGRYNTAAECRVIAKKALHHD